MRIPTSTVERLSVYYRSILPLKDSSVISSKNLSDITGYRVVSLHTDISTKTGERVIVFVLDKNLENKFRKE